MARTLKTTVEKTEEVSQLIAEETLTPTEEPVIEVKPEVVAKKAPSEEAAIVLAPVEKNPSAWNIKQEDGKVVFYSPAGRILKNITIAEFNKLMKQ
jgi:hypothetical protein